jgi:tyrosyl-DNA phosphodiesterase-1
MDHMDPAPSDTGIENLSDRKRPPAELLLSSDEKRTKPNSSPAPIYLFATRDRERSPNDRSFREMLGYDTATSSLTIHSMIICNYMIDFEFLLHEIPELLTIPQITLFYGHETNPEYLMQWKQATFVDARLLRPSDPPRSLHNPLPFRIPYGVHHSKIIVFGYREETTQQEKLRLIIHTANLLERDIHRKIQGACIQDFPLKNTECSPSPSDFENDLVAYYDTYDYTRPRIWSPSTQTSPCSLIQWLRQYDFSSASVALVPSTPGYHRVSDSEHPNRALQGHLRIQQLLRQRCARYTKQSPATSTGPVVCQFSSMGSLTEKYLNELYQSMDVRSASRPKHERPSSSPVPLAQKLQLVYPTVEQIRTSYEGYSGGGSVPGPYRNVSKAFLRPLYHRWSDEGRKHVGHIKTYYQLSNDGSRNDEDDDCADNTMEWFVLTSHNLSKAAWGEVQMRSAGRRLFIRHWELGVWLGSSDETKLAPYGTTIPQTRTVPLPYPVRPVRYRANDQPWAVDGVYDIPDALGCVQLG